MTSREVWGLGGCGKGGDVVGSGFGGVHGGIPRFSVVWLWLRSDTPWPRPTPARGSKCNAVRKSALKGQSRRDRRKRKPGAARSFFHRLARAWEQSSLAGLVSLPWYAHAREEEIALGTPHALCKQVGRGNGAAMQIMENDKAVFHPSHSRLEDAGEARVSHIPTTTTAEFMKKNKRQLLPRPERRAEQIKAVADARQCLLISCSILQSLAAGYRLCGSPTRLCTQRQADSMFCEGQKISLGWNND